MPTYPNYSANISSNILKYSDQSSLKNIENSSSSSNSIQQRSKITVAGLNRLLKSWGFYGLNQKSYFVFRDALEIEYDSDMKASNNYCACNICEYIAMDVDHIFVHQVLKHPNKLFQTLYYRCQKLTKKDNKYLNIQNELNSSQMVNINEDDYQFCKITKFINNNVTKESLNKNNDDESMKDLNINDSYLYCLHCNASFVQPNDVWIHFVEVHPMERLSIYGRTNYVINSRYDVDYSYAIRSFAQQLDQLRENSSGDKSQNDEKVQRDGQDDSQDHQNEGENGQNDEQNSSQEGNQGNGDDQGDDEEDKSRKDKASRKRKLDDLDDPDEEEEEEEEKVEESKELEDSSQKGQLELVPSDQNQICAVIDGEDRLKLSKKITKKSDEPDKKRRRIDSVKDVVKFSANILKNLAIATGVYHLTHLLPESFQSFLE